MIIHDFEVLSISISIRDQFDKSFLAGPCAGPDDFSVFTIYAYRSEYLPGFMLIVSLRLGDLSMVIHNSSVILLMMIQLSFYTFAGDCLEMRSIALSYATYGYNWYDLPAATARDIRFILMRANIPHQLTAGKFVPMNMMTFKDILKSTASYLSVLRVMLDE